MIKVNSSCPLFRTDPLKHDESKRGDASYPVVRICHLEWLTDKRQMQVVRLFGPATWNDWLVTSLDQTHWGWHFWWKMMITSCSFVGTWRFDTMISKDWFEEIRPKQDSGDWCNHVWIDIVYMLCMRESINVWMFNCMNECDLYECMSCRQLRMTGKLDETRQDM